VDWVLVEGFKYSALPKIEVWRVASNQPTLYAQDDWIVAIATDSPAQLPSPARRPVFDLNDASAVADYLLAQQARFVYAPDGVDKADGLGQRAG
jgi:molybdopterin-guanine dinucleotide biosynthesis protein B